MKKVPNPDLQARLAEIDGLAEIEEAILLRRVTIIKKRYVHLRALEA